MGNILDLIRDILPRKNVVVNQNNQGGNAYMNNNEIANTINRTTVFNVVDTKQIAEIYESVLNESSPVDLKEAIVPIESLINQGKFKLAIKKYEEFIASTEFSKYSKDERFLIYNGLFNCHLNDESAEEVIEYWAQKIQALGDVEEIHRYYFLMGVREYNKRNFDNAFIYAKKAISMKSDYMNGLTLEILVSASSEAITYDKAKNQLKKLLKRDGLGVKEHATIHSCFGDIAFNAKDYITAQKQYEKADKYSSSLDKKIGIAVCQYFLSFKELHFDRNIEFDKIDFDKLDVAKQKFDDIYSNKTDESINTIVNLGLNYYISILALCNNHNEILKVYEETKELIKDSMTEGLQHIAEAQAINGILDKSILDRLGEYEQIKYEAFYYERKGNCKKVIELLTPVFDTEHKNQKVLQLSYLVALQEDDDFDRYMHYYQKFNADDDEVMRMNYIQFLDKRDEKKKVINELIRLKPIMRNGFIIYEYMLLCLNYKLDDELKELFEKVDSGEYTIIGFQKARVFFEKMIFLLNSKQYSLYFTLYEDSDLSILDKKHRVILKINYYMFKHDYENLASAYYEYFKLTENHNELIKAVQTKLQINQYYEADNYLQQVNPMLLDLPEYYYMFKAIVLQEMGKVDEAFRQLEIVLESIDIELDSPFHQFYVAFNVNNNRTDAGFSYMGEYYSKSPNPEWFKVIHFSDNESGKDLISKLEEAVGGKRDLTEINRYFSQGAFGASVYNRITGTGFEDVLIMKHYPFTTIPVSRGHLAETQSKSEIIEDRIIVDASSLVILASVDGLELLDVLKEIIIPFSTVTRLTQDKSGVLSHYTKKALDYVSSSPRIKRVPVDEAMKLAGEDIEILYEDIRDCIVLSSNSKVPFLNTEVVVGIKYNFLELLDINTLLFYLKAKYDDRRVYISTVIANLRKFGYEFISFDADDMFHIYNEFGIDGLTPFLKMGRNADYKTFGTVYVGFLNRISKSKTEEEFLNCSSIIIKFMDKYIGKTKYYTGSLIRQFPSLEKSLSKQLMNPTAKNIMFSSAMISVIPYNDEYLDALEAPEMNKLKSIASGFMFFVFQYVSLFKDDKEPRTKYIKHFKECCSLNSDDDIEYIIQFLTSFENRQK